MVCAISCKDPADILAASSFLFSLAVLSSCASLSCVWSLLRLGTLPRQLRLPRSAPVSSSELSCGGFPGQRRGGGGQTRWHGPRGQGRIRKVRVFFSRAEKVLLPRRSQVARSACIWDDLPHCLASKDRPAPGPGWACARLPTSSDTRLLPIHLPSLCAEVTAGIQLFVKGL